MMPKDIRGKWRKIINESITGVRLAWYRQCLVFNQAQTRSRNEDREGKGYHPVTVQ